MESPLSSPSFKKSEKHFKFLLSSENEDLLEAAKIIRETLAHKDNSLTATVVPQWSKFTLEFSNWSLGHVSKLKECIKGINDQEIILYESMPFQFRTGLS
jgi:hypothetical protein